MLSTDQIFLRLSLSLSAWKVVVYIVQRGKKEAHHVCYIVREDGIDSLIEFVMIGMASVALFFTFN